MVPAELVLVETDAPFLTPVPNRGKSNAPAQVAHTLRALAAVRELDVAELCAVIEATGERVFGPWLRARCAAPSRPAWPRLLGPTEIRALAGRLGIAAVQAAGPELRRGRRDGGPDRGPGPADPGRRGAGGRAGLRLADPAAAGRGRRRSLAVEIDAVLAAELPRDRGRPARRSWPARLTVVTADAARVARAARRRRRPRWWPTCPTTSPCRWCCTCWPRSRSLRRGLVMVQAEVADRMSAPPGSRDLRHPVGQAGLVRRRAPGRARCRGACSGRCPGWTPGWSRSRSATPPAGRGAADREAGVRGHRRGVRAAAQDAAGRPGGLGRVGRRRRSGGCGPRASTRRGAASRWASASSRASRRPGRPTDPSAGQRLARLG